MSGDLISRKEALDAIMSTEPFIVEINGEQYVGQKTSDVMDVLQALSSAEPERKTGKWIDEKINSYTSRTYCSECGSSAPFVYESDDYYGNHAHGETAKTKFCPNCGADMRSQNT